MEIGRVARQSKIKIIKANLSKPILLLKSYRSTKLKKLIMVLVVFIFSFFSLVNIKGVVQNSVSNYYVNADSATQNQDIKPPVISTDVSQSKISDAFSSNSNATYIDKRAYVLDRYLQSNNSPLAGYGQVFVDSCTKYGAPKECITVVAIAYNETHLCKYPGSAEMFNCWGFGGGGENRIAFSSFNESIDQVTKILAIQYGYKYMEDPSLMEGTFCGNEEGCTGWGNKIKYFMKDIRNYAASLGVNMAN
ncbi:MAG: hypothetical protein ABI721_00665 [Candidatus Dojkabacteria bacterium]